MKADKFTLTIDMGEHQFRHRSLQGVRVYEHIPVREGDFLPSTEHNEGD